jgi:hypothetical protein
MPSATEISDGEASAQRREEKGLDDRTGMHLDHKGRLAFTGIPGSGRANLICLDRRDLHNMKETARNIHKLYNTLFTEVADLKFKELQNYFYAITALYQDCQYLDAMATHYSLRPGLECKVTQTASGDFTLTFTTRGETYSLAVQDLFQRVVRKELPFTAPQTPISVSRPEEEVAREETEPGEGQEQQDVADERSLTGSEAGDQFEDTFADIIDPRLPTTGSKNKRRSTISVETGGRVDDSPESTSVEWDNLKLAAASSMMDQVDSLLALLVPGRHTYLGRLYTSYLVGQSGVDQSGGAIVFLRFLSNHIHQVAQSTGAFAQMVVKLDNTKFTFSMALTAFFKKK